MPKYIKPYKELLEVMTSELIDDSDDDRLERARDVDVEYIGVQHRTAQNRIKTVFFDTKDKHGSGKTWRVKLQIPDYRQISKSKKMSAKEKVEMTLTAGDVKMDCGCPDFLYKGYKYIGTQLNYSIKSETIPPYIRNPKMTGTLCKHGLAILLNLDKYIDDISKDIDDYGKITKKKY